MSKGSLANFIALLIFLSSFLVDNEFSNYLYYMGLFALSGAITNQIAIYMIFNKIPFLYGSGVIELNFKKFKASLKSMIMEQFFTKERIEKFFKEEENKIDLVPLVDKIDFNPSFDALKESIMESKFGQIINMFGGESSLELLRVTFVKKINSSIKSVLNSKTFKKQLDSYLQSSSLSEDLIIKLDNIISQRLDDLSARDVKNLVLKLIKEHLDWLVVWGAIFGGLIGLISSIFTH